MKTREYEHAGAGAGHPQVSPVLPEYSLGARLSGFLSLIRPLFFILTPVNAAGAAVLAYGGFPPLDKCVAGAFAVAFASCTVNVFNDYADHKRDKIIWPNRAIPSGRVTTAEALIVVIAAMIISLSISWFVFNPPTFTILLASIVMGVLYSAYLREKVGYLTLSPIVGLIYLGGWTAFAPGTLFTTWLPWYLYLLGVVWQTAHIMIYYPLHLAPSSGGSSAKPPKVFFFVPLPQSAVNIGVTFCGLTLVLAILLFFITPLNIVYPIIVVVAGAYALFHAFRLRGKVMDRGQGTKAFTAVSTLRLAISAAILLSVFFTGVGWL
ncbi:MAG: hypothetical protein A2144_07945 [Chloroflexi bacterium RBG_16_50_9]|nr:MAG: hypothetical protein A2144_07945 [Chloroflexi bacterium RBG_16_50_9]